GEGRDGGERVNDPQSPAPDPHPGPLPERAREDAPVVRLEEIVKSYRRGVQTVPVLAGISFDIAAGEFLALMGPSGSGKSTLLNLIAGIDRPDSGRLIVAGTDIGRLTEQELADWRSRNIGFIFQFYNLMPVLDALENVELPLLLTGLSRRQRRERARMALDMVSLSDRLDHFPSELSGGQQQRVAIARALVTDPTLIVADEPTGDLDRESANDVLGMLERLNQQIGKTIIMVTHDQRAAQHAHAIMHLEKGELSQREELAAS
ncbi:MAG: ABC transporter ATP-binding protein, partial [Candidatus Methylophosphatis roskildensis]